LQFFSHYDAYSIGLLELPLITIQCTCCACVLVADDKSSCSGTVPQRALYTDRERKRETATACMNIAVKANAWRHVTCSTQRSAVVHIRKQHRLPSRTNSAEEVVYDTGLRRAFYSNRPQTSSKRKKRYIVSNVVSLWKFARAFCVRFGALAKLHEQWILSIIYDRDDVVDQNSALKPERWRRLPMSKQSPSMLRLVEFQADINKNTIDKAVYCSLAASSGSTGYWFRTSDTWSKGHSLKSHPQLGKPIIHLRLCRQAALASAERLIDWFEFNGTFSTVRLYRAFRSYSLRFGK